MDRIAAKHQERVDLVHETAARRGLAPAIIEKDFWVCWALQKLFVVTEGQPSLLFKGSTSLSKAFGLIRRFSEDIDLSLDRRDLRFKDERDPMNVASNKKASALIKELTAEAEKYIGVQLLPRLRQQFAEVLGEKPVWSLEIDPSDAQQIRFAYPKPASPDESLAILSVQPVVRLEFGARSDHWPAGDYQVRSYAAEEFPDLFTRPACSVRTLEAVRTFWEKATLLHAEYHRQPPKVERLSRHYYDLAELARSNIRDKALGGLDLLTHVARHKKKFFRAAWANYDEARPGSLHLVPHAELHAGLQHDYERMREMFFDEPPPFDQIIGTVKELEEQINSFS